jgi:NADH oxidase (H2O-forming)
MPVEIKKGISWVGATNPDLRVFDVIMHTQWGTSYNSYLIQGNEKTALVDTVKPGFADEHIERISGVCDVSSIDYIICNHTEPDHSGSLEKMLELAPNATVTKSTSAAKRCGLSPRRFCIGPIRCLPTSCKTQCC